MALAKFSFIFDDETARTLRLTAARLRKSQSRVVREAVAEDAARAGRLTATERSACPRRREVDLAVAACAIAQGAGLWTLHPRDFADIPGLELVP